MATESSRHDSTLPAGTGWPATAMNARMAFSERGGGASDPLEVPLDLPVGDHGVEPLPLLLGRVDQVVVDVLAEGVPGHLAVLEQLDGLDDVPRDPGDVLGLVGVPPVP